MRPEAMSNQSVPPISDPHAVKEIVATAIAGIENINGLVTLTFVTNRAVPNGFGETQIERAISARLSMAHEAVKELNDELSAYLSTSRLR